jgi:hypothetical protein
MRDEDEGQGSAARDEEPYEHAPEDLGDKVFEAICVELKK